MTRDEAIEEIMLINGEDITAIKSVIRKYDEVCRTVDLLSSRLNFSYDKIYGIYYQAAMNVLLEERD